MSPGKPKPRKQPTDEISALIETLLETEQRLKDLTAGEIDTVVGRDGRTFMLPHAQDQLRRSEIGKQAAILSALPAHIALLDAQGIITLVNESWRKFSDTNLLHGPEHSLGMNYLDICDRSEGEGSAEAHRSADGIRSVLDGSAKTFSIEYSCHSSSEQRWFQMIATPLSDDRKIGAVIMHVNISERKRTEVELRELALQMVHSAQHDFLTALPNRMLLNDRINQAIVLAPRHDRQVAVLFLDLDGFKHINDSLGHSIGDKLLQSIAARLTDCVRHSDTVSRQGGDEFVVLLSDAAQWEDAAIIANRMLQVVAKSHSIDQHDLHITASIGISVFPDDGLDAETLIMNADTAMYQAKENGRHNFQYFRPAMNIRAVERQSIEESLRRALEHQEFVLHYQPKVDLKTGAMTGAEALIRWQHPTRGLVFPGLFIPVAEDCGLIQPIGRWVLREACRQAQAWIAAGLPKITIAVNVSAMDLRDDDFLNSLFAILNETGMDSTSLELELTESVLMKHAATSARILKTLREKGVQVAIDDFGTGYSSLSYLQKLPIDSLKIDQSFVRQISAGEEDTTIVTAIISMAQSLKLRVIAEGVETQEELNFLKAHRCDEAQGYFLGGPMTAEQFEDLLRTGIVNPSATVRPTSSITDLTAADEHETTRRLAQPSHDRAVQGEQGERDRRQDDSGLAHRRKS